MPRLSPARPFPQPALSFSLLTRFLKILSDHRRALIGHRDVEHAQLRAFRSLITVHDQRSRHMQRLFAMLDQRVAQPLAERAKRDAIEDGTVTGFETQA